MIDLQNPALFAGNWNKFDSYSPGIHDEENPELWGLIYYVTRDSDLLAESNWVQIQKRMTPFFNDDTAKIQRDSHWACGWVEGIFCKVYTDDTKSETTAAYNELVEIEEEIEDYPALNDEHYSELEYNAMYDNFESEFGFIIRTNNYIIRTDKEYNFGDILDWFEDKNYWRDIENVDGKGAYPSTDHLLECILDLGLVVSIYNPVWWAKDNGIKLVFSKLYAPLFDDNKDHYLVGLYIGSKYVLSFNDYAVEPGANPDDTGYRDILFYLDRFLDLKDSDNPLNRRDYELAERFSEALPDDSRSDFVDHMLEFGDR